MKTKIVIIAIVVAAAAAAIVSRGDRYGRREILSRPFDAVLTMDSSFIEATFLEKDKKAAD